MGAHEHRRSKRRTPEAPRGFDRPRAPRPGARTWTHPNRHAIELRQFEYSDEDRGEETLREVLANHSAQVVLGPTDSGVFERIAGRSGLVQQARVPIISPLVTLPFVNRKDGWLSFSFADLRRWQGGPTAWRRNYWRR